MGELGKAQLSEMELKTGAMHRLSMRVQELESELAHRTAMLSLVLFTLFNKIYV